MKTNGNYPAHPTGDHSNIEPDYGLTKREYFAAIAMKGLLSNYKPSDFTGGMVQLQASIVITACEIADNIINQLNQTSI